MLHNNNNNDIGMFDENTKTNSEKRIQCILKNLKIKQIIMRC